jgi:hypothetical protein
VAADRRSYIHRGIPDALCHLIHLIKRIIENAVCRSLRVRCGMSYKPDTGSTLCVWSVDADSITEHDRRHILLTEYLTNGPRGNEREVARSLRPHVEAYLRVACPQYLPPGTMLGPFHALCETRYGLTNQILNRQDMDELLDIKEFANRYHHDTNPVWETETINDEVVAPTPINA